MSDSKTLKFFLTVLMASIVLSMMGSAPWEAEARYLPTRSDPLAPIGPPRGEDPRFDRLYDIIRELLRNEGSDMMADDSGHRIHSADVGRY